MAAMTTLLGLRDGDRAVVREIGGGTNVRRRLNRMGLHANDLIRVVKCGYFGGLVLIEVHGMEFGIGRAMAEKVAVEVSG